MPPKGKAKAEVVEEVVEEQPKEIEAGEGEFSFADGSTYSGAWVKSAETGAIVREGRGVLTHVSIGYKYVGEWKADKMAGYGEFTYASGAKYAGQWQRNRYQGHGKYIFPDGSSYEGAWVDNQMHGAGIFVDTKGISWKGQFYNGTGPGLHALVV